MVTLDGEPELLGHIAVGGSFEVLDLTDAVRWAPWRWGSFDAETRRYPSAQTSPVFALRSEGRVFVASAVDSIGREVVWSLERGDEHAEGTALSAGSVALRVAIGGGPAASRVIIDALRSIEYADVFRTYASSFAAAVEGRASVAEPRTGGEPWLLVRVADPIRLSPSNRRGYLLADNETSAWNKLVAQASYRRAQGRGPIVLEHPAGLQFLHRDLNPPFSIGRGLSDAASRAIRSLADDGPVYVLWKNAWRATKGFDRRGFLDDSDECFEAMSAEIEALQAVGFRGVLLGAPPADADWKPLIDRLVERFPDLWLAMEGPVPDIVRHRVASWTAVERPSPAAAVEIRPPDLHDPLNDRDAAAAILSPHSPSIALIRSDPIATTSREDVARLTEAVGASGRILLFESALPLRSWGSD
ncbi:MAG: hypothetical protein AAF108_03850 [Planctomycetota bacterium]